ncbi:MAG: response regulator [Candidatus Hydrothermarchaeales archaeon]
MGVLVVDDEGDIVKLVKIALEREGYQVSIASSGKEALERLTKEKMDLIILDVMMPEMNGWEVVEAIRGGDPTNKDTPILMLTVMKEIGDIERGYRVGVNDYIAKPFKREILVKGVAHLLSEAVKVKEARGTQKVVGEEVFKELFNRHPNGVLLVDDDMTIVAMNPASEAITGWKAKDVVGKMTWDELLSCHNAAGHTLIPSECLRALYNPDEAATHSEFCIKTGEGMEIPISAEAFQLRTSGLSAVALRNISKEKLHAGSH